VKDTKIIAIVLGIMSTIISPGCGPKERVSSVTSSPMVKPAGCPARQDQPISRAEGSNHLIITLKGRNETIDIMSGTKELRYSITTNSGEVILSKGTKQDLQEEYPEIYKRLEEAIAEIWAGM